MDDPRIRLPEVPEELRDRLSSGGAVAWREPVEITTYAPRPPERSPMYFERRVYQGSSGRVYPLPFIDSIATEPTVRTWDAVHLENEWLRVMILPELGGRIHVGYDKTADYDFFYRNNVIKPALVGLAGPWVSGGVEFNWPQHHRPATFLPVDTALECAEDGTATVWCSDHEPFDRMKGSHGVRLHGDSSLLEVLGRVHNRTSLRQTFLWWANAAARVHDDYQSFFPTDVRYVADHARRAVTAFPEADRSYYGVDYPARHDSGRDRLDFYANIPVPTSYMVTESKDCFFGGYDHAARAGFVHVADRRIAPGKKQWTWGNAPFGWAWDRLLTDGDGPYVELMAGVYTDNQPDFAWLEPGETKTFTQAWYPIHEIGVAHQASEEGAVHLELMDEGVADVGLCVTRRRPASRVVVSCRGRAVHDVEVDLAPGRPWRSYVDLGDLGIEANETQVELHHEGRLLLSWRPRPEDEGQDLREPATATAPPAPADVPTVDELHLTGVHLRQYRHPTRSPLPYWEEGLARDPGHVGCHLGLADDALRRGIYAEAERHARAALDRLTERNANPMSGEASYLRGLVAARTGRFETAMEALAKAAWNRAYVAPASVEIARLAIREGDDAAALARAEAALDADPQDSRALALVTVLRRRLGDQASADGILQQWLGRDVLDQVARALAGLDLSADPRTVIDVALDLAAAGEHEQALGLLERASSMDPTDAGEVRPMAHYHRSAILDRLDRPEEAAAARDAARRAPADLCFPCGLDDHDALRAALAAEPRDSRAAELLALLLVAWDRPEEALALWRANDDLLGPVALRTFAVTAYNHLGDAELACRLFERAVALNPEDARLLLESDALRERMGDHDRTRLARLEAHPELVQQRDDLTVTCADLLTSVGRADDARRLLSARRLAPWEGGEGRALRAWDRAVMSLARRALDDGRPEEALKLLADALEPPESLGEARHPLEPPAAVLSLHREARDALGRADETAPPSWTGAVAGLLPGQAGVAGDADEVDFFATSNPDLMTFTRRA